jgi:hypothetical protein
VSTKIGDAATQYRIPASGNCHVGHAVSEFGFEAPTGAIWMNTTRYKKKKIKIKLHNKIEIEREVEVYKNAEKIQTKFARESLNKSFKSSLLLRNFPEH